MKKLQWIMASAMLLAASCGRPTLNGKENTWWIPTNNNSVAEGEDSMYVSSNQTMVLIPFEDYYGKDVMLSLSDSVLTQSDFTNANFYAIARGSNHAHDTLFRCAYPFKWIGKGLKQSQAWKSKDLLVNQTPVYYWEERDTIGVLTNVAEGTQSLYTKFHSDPKE